MIWDVLATLIGMALLVWAGWHLHALYLDATKDRRLTAALERLSDDEVDHLVRVLYARPSLYDGAADFEERS